MEARTQAIIGVVIFCLIVLGVVYGVYYFVSTVYEHKKIFIVNETKITKNQTTEGYPSSFLLYLKERSYELKASTYEKTAALYRNLGNSSLLRNSTAGIWFLAKADELDKETRILRLKAAELREVLRKTSEYR